MTARIAPCLWFDRNAEEAVGFYAGLFPDTRIDRIVRATVDYPAGKEGDVLLIEFTLLGMAATALNGGDYFTFNEAVSFQVYTADQAETDRYWDAIVGGGGSEQPCGWCKDRFGLSWQIVPRALMDMQASADRAAARRATEAMFTMRRLDVARLEAAFRGEAA